MGDIQQRQQWLSALNGHFERQSVLKPLPARQDLAKSEEFQCRIIGGTLLDWLNRHGPPLLQEREVLREVMSLESGMAVEGDPTIVFTSDVPGLVAAHQILNPKPDSIFFFSPEAFALFLEENPDNAFCWHVKYSSSFSCQMSPEEFARASRQFPLRDGEQFWLHRESSMLGVLFGRGGDHLWKSDGENWKLLEEGFNRWVS